MKATIIALALLTIMATAHAETYEKVSDHVARKAVYQNLTIERLEQDKAAAQAQIDKLTVMVNDEVAKIAQIEADIAGLTAINVTKPIKVEGDLVIVE